MSGCFGVLLVPTVAQQILATEATFGELERLQGLQFRYIGTVTPCKLCFQ
jgi:hypothetical protein